MGAGASVPDNEDAALAAGFTQAQIDSYKATHEIEEPDFIARARVVFEVVDADSSGSLNYTELKKVLALITPRNT